MVKHKAKWTSSIIGWLFLTSFSCRDSLEFGSRIILVHYQMKDKAVLRTLATKEAVWRANDLGFSKIILLVGTKDTTKPMANLCHS